MRDDGGGTGARYAGQRQLAASIADAVVDYLEEYERRTDAAADSGLSAR